MCFSIIKILFGLILVGVGAFGMKIVKDGWTDLFFKPAVHSEKAINEQTYQSLKIIEDLRNKSMWSTQQKGDRRSFVRLLSWRENTKDAIVREALVSAIEDVEKHYATDIMRLAMEPVPNRFGQFLCKESDPPCANGFEPPEGFKAQNVIGHFSRSWWQERGRAAVILKNIKTAAGSYDKRMLFESLISRLDLEKENSLFVAKMALETYSDLAGFTPGSVFAFEDAVFDWEKRQQDILKQEL